MSFATVARSTADPALQSRITACVAQEQLSRGEPPNPGLLSGQMAWAVGGASDVAAAYASAIAADNPDPGGDEAVISDQMILSNVQAHWPTTP